MHFEIYILSLFCPLGTPIHLILRVYQFVCPPIHASCMYTRARRTYALVRIHIHTKTEHLDIIGEATAGSMVSEHSSIPRGISHLPRSSGALSSIWQIASPKCYILYLPACAPRVLYPRTWPSFPVERDNALLMRMRFAYFYKNDHVVCFTVTCDRLSFYQLAKRAMNKIESISRREIWETRIWIMRTHVK